ncbi:MAG TPA: hypothetical protein VFU81_10330 [Thermomicrobiales bacterium]|nr:hypothetical protein [Thermomicrobiales bacterium]
MFEPVEPGGIVNSGLPPRNTLAELAESGVTERVLLPLAAPLTETVSLLAASP